VSINNAVDLHTDALIDGKTVFSVIRHNVLIVASTAFDASIRACGFNLGPIMVIVTRLWTSTNTWIIRSTAITLDRTKLLVSPVDMDSMSIAFLSISTNSSTQAFAISTRITCTGIKYTVIVVVRWIDMSMTSGKCIRVDN